MTWNTSVEGLGLQEVIADRLRRGFGEVNGFQCRLVDALKC